MQLPVETEKNHEKSDQIYVSYYKVNEEIK
jgi:hypothetical protein